METKFLIIGSGIAGLMAALEASEKNQQVILITKNDLENSNSYYAQGGVSAVDAKRVKKNMDSYESFIEDTMNAGDGLCNLKIVSKCAYNFFDKVINFLINKGVDFSKSDNLDNYEYELHQEGGHRHERVYCVGDYTGEAIIKTLIKEVRTSKNIKILENHLAISLITQNQILKENSFKDKCLGIYALDKKAGEIITIRAKNVFLATGGAGKVFQYTSNPKVSTGDGIAMAYRAGAKIANMEFYQFHPTVLYEHKFGDNSVEKRFLITEALRGEKIGGILTLRKNSTKDFILNFDERGSHATRDIVARGIDNVMKKEGLTHVWLNVTTKVTGKTEEYYKNNFPQIYQKCLEENINIAFSPIPVVPAAHYCCGGVLTDEFGQTDIENLYAIGEVACTGLMGANRLASNSLPESAYFGRIAIENAINNLKYNYNNDSNIELPLWKDFLYTKTKIDLATMNQFWDITRTVMTNLCGIERNKQRLKLAYNITSALSEASENIYKNFFPCQEIIELRNLNLVARLITKSALLRKESRGSHFRLDFPQKNETYKMPSLLQIFSN